MLTTFLTRSDVSRNMQALHLLREFREAFVASVSSAPSQTSAPDRDGAVRSATQADGALSVVTVRSGAGQGARSVLQLVEGPTGKLMAVMEATQLASLRNALVGALGTDVLARESSADVAVLGSGPAVISALKALRLVRGIDRVWLYQPDAAANFELAMKLVSSLSMAVRAAESPEVAVKDADIVLLTGGVPLSVTQLRPGTHVTVLGANEFSQPALSPELLSSARLVTDGPLAWRETDAHLGHVLAGTQPGRSSRDDVTLFASVCPPFLDLVAARHVFEGAQRDEALTRFDLEA